MRLRRMFIAMFLSAISAHAVVAADDAPSSLPPDVLLQFEGRELPPIEHLRSSGVLPGPTPGLKSEVSEMGYITLWYTHYDAIVGTLDDDLIGEAGVTPVCYGEPITDREGAPSMYRGYWTYPEIWTYYYNAYENYDTCETVYENQVRYFLTQVRSPRAQTARLFVGADDGIKVWINGVQVMRHEGGEYMADQYDVEVQLVEGWNLILVKVHYPLLGPYEHPEYEPRAWSLRLADASGSEPLHLVQSLDGWCGHEETYNWVHAGGAADLPGAFGSQWASDLRLTNPYHYPLELTVEYYEEGSVSAAPAKARPPEGSLAATPTAAETVVIEPFESVTYRRVLTSLLGVAPPQKGMIAVRGYYYYDAQSYGTVELKTYNQSDGGTFGSVIPMTYTYAGTTCCSQVLYGLRNGVGFRTNIGMAPRRSFDDELAFTVSIWDSATGAFAEKDFIGRGNFQLNDIFSKLGLGDLETDTAVAYISWQSTGTGGRYRFFGSVVDNATSDPVDVGPGYWFRPPPLQ